MIYYSIIYPPILPITIPAFEWNRDAQGNPSLNERWRLYFEPSIGNRLEDFKGGFIRVRRAESEVTIFNPEDPEPYLYDLIPFRNPFAEYRDPYDSNKDELQPIGYPVDMPKVNYDEEIDSYYIDIPHSIFFEERGHLDTRFKVQMMFTSDWIKSDTNSGSGVLYFYNTDLEEYEPIDKKGYFSGNLVEKGLSEWSRVTIVSPMSPADYGLVYKFTETEGARDVGYLNSPIIEFLGERRNHFPKSGIDGNDLQGYRITIYSSEEDKPKAIIDDSNWIVGQENPNLEIRWQNEIELENKTYYWIKLEIQTIWDLRKEFWQLCYSSFEASLFQGQVKAINDHDKARVKIVINAKSPLTWGPSTKLELDEQHTGFVKVKNEYDDKDFYIEQGIDMTTRGGSFAVETIVANIEPVKNWEEDETKYFFRMSGPELSIHNPYQEEYLLYAHSVPISDSYDYGIYEEDVIINPIMTTPTTNVAYETYMSPTGHMGLGVPDQGVISTGGTDAPASHSFIMLRDITGKMWRVVVSEDGVFVTSRAFEFDSGTDEEERPVYLYDRHNLFIKELIVEPDGRLALGGKAVKFERGKGSRPLYINEFRFVKRVWGLQLGRKTLIAKQTYKAFMNDFNRKIGNWQVIDPNNQYYIYMASTKGQLYLFVKDLTAAKSGKNSIDRYNLSYASSGMDLPDSSLFVITEGLSPKFVPIEDEKGNRIKYAISVDERGSLVSDIASIGTTSTSQAPIYRKFEDD